VTEPSFPTPEPPPILPSYPPQTSSAPSMPPVGPSPPTFLPPPPAPVAPAPARPPIRLLDALLTGQGGPIVRAAFLFYGVVLLFAIGYAIFGGVAGRLFGDRMPHPNSLLVGLVLGLAIVGACQVTMRTLPAVGAAANEIEKILGPLSYPAVAALAVVSGFTEELLFRGALWPHLGLAGTTFLFGLVHVVPNRALSGYPIFALAAGFLLGLLRNATDNVLPCMVAHVTVNAVNLGWLEYRRRRTAAHAAAPVPQA
jgi:membrane protease YdiL (CAAX protease family)